VSFEARALSGGRRRRRLLLRFLHAREASSAGVMAPVQCEESMLSHPLSVELLASANVAPCHVSSSCSRQRARQFLSQAEEGEKTSDPAAIESPTEGRDGRHCFFFSFVSLVVVYGVEWRVWRGISR
jgi:hypothetical protein